MISSITPISRMWYFTQALVWMLSFTMIVCLFVAPEVGLHAFWDVLIPVAPALVAIFPGLWRNICPAAVMSQLPRHFGMTRRKKLSMNTNGWLILVSVALLLLIIPLRHSIFDLNGPATGIFLVVTTVIAIVLTFLFDGKSGWCASLCPVHQVEKLYGQRVVLTTVNAHCIKCSKCVIVCPDSIPTPSPHVGGNSWPRRVAVFILIGCFPGYVWGWFQVQDYSSLSNGLANIGNTYMFSVIGGTITLTLYALLIRSTPKRKRKIIDRLFAAAAISCYYWFRLPWLIGFSQFEGNGMLIDFSNTISPVAISIVPYCITAFWVWWIALRQNGLQSWMRRPTYEPSITSTVDLRIST